MPKFFQQKFPSFRDDRGDLTPFELKDFPFAVQRVYVVTANQGQVRGGHAHHHEAEMFFAIGGSITAMVDDGTGKQIIQLGPDQPALAVEPYCWHEFYDFAPGASLLCFSSVPYSPGDDNYIMDYSEFQTIAKTKNT